MATTDYSLIGKKTVYIGQEEFAPELVGSDGITITLTPNTVDVESQAGTISVPTGTYSEISATIPLIIPNMTVLGRIFPSLATKGTAGTKVTFGAGECTAITSSPIVIHNTCDADSTNDVYIPAALIQNGGEFAIGSTSDPVTIELNVTMLPDEKGYVNFGCSDPTKRTKYDPSTMSYKEVTDSQTTNWTSGE
jgi:hypothetical protein